MSHDFKIHVNDDVNESTSSVVNNIQKAFETKETNNI